MGNRDIINLSLLSLSFKLENSFKKFKIFERSLKYITQMMIGFQVKVSLELVCSIPMLHLWHFVVGMPLVRFIVSSCRASPALSSFFSDTVSVTFDKTF